VDVQPLLGKKRVQDSTVTRRDRLSLTEGGDPHLMHREKKEKEPKRKKKKDGGTARLP